MSGASVKRLLLVMLLALALLPAGCAAPATSATAPASNASLASTAERERFASEARWAPGQLDAHFQKHRDGYGTVQEYDRGARDVIRKGTAFTYLDRESGDRHLGFYDKPSNRFTAMTLDGRRITTHFQPDNGERYVRGLPESTYR